MPEEPAVGTPALPSNSPPDQETGVEIVSPDQILAETDSTKAGAARNLDPASWNAFGGGSRSTGNLGHARNPRAMDLDELGNSESNDLIGTQGR